MNLIIIEEPFITNNILHNSTSLYDNSYNGDARLYLRSVQAVEQNEKKIKAYTSRIIGMHWRFWKYHLAYLLMSFDDISCLFRLFLRQMIMHMVLSPLHACHETQLFNFFPHVGHDWSNDDRLLLSYYFTDEVHIFCNHGKKVDCTLLD